jgi:anti-sigma regulatory factor (Ser/Thr protein kinase)
MDSLVLGVSELVTNAVVHAGTDITVTVRQLSKAIRVEVEDLDPRLPQGREVSIDADSGRGLSIIEGFGLRWGANGRAPGKTVWIEADTAPSK